MRALPSPLRKQLESAVRFARFLAEIKLLLHPEDRAPVTLRAELRRAREPLTAASE